MVRCFTIIFFGLTFVGCSNSDRLQDNSGGDTPSEIQYSLVYLIHGDAGYLYHDDNGKPAHADKEALREAISVGESNTRAEVFIFHQRPRSHILYLFPRKESSFYYFRGGEKVAGESYFSYREESEMLAEAGLYHKYAAQNKDNMSRLFMYYGHEIPETEGAGYHSSVPHKEFNVEKLVQGLNYFNDLDTNKKMRFDLTVLSTCNNGSAELASRLSSQTKYLIASPEDLHLSYIDSQILQDPDEFSGHNVQLLALRFAENAFDILTGAVQTSVSISLYDTDRVRQAIRNNPQEDVYPGEIVFFRESTFGRNSN